MGLRTPGTMKIPNANFPEHGELLLLVSVHQRSS